MADITAAGSPTRAEHDLWGYFWIFCDQFRQAAFVVGGLFCDIKTPSLALIALLRVVCWPIQAVFVLQEPLCDVGTPS